MAASCTFKTSKLFSQKKKRKKKEKQTNIGMVYLKKKIVLVYGLSLGLD